MASRGRGRVPNVQRQVSFEVRMPGKRPASVQRTPSVQRTQSSYLPTTVHVRSSTPIRSERKSHIPTATVATIASLASLKKPLCELPSATVVQAIAAIPRPLTSRSSFDVPRATLFGPNSAVAVAASPVLPPRGRMPVSRMASQPPMAVAVGAAPAPAPPQVRTAWLSPAQAGVRAQMLPGAFAPASRIVRHEGAYAASVLDTSQWASAARNFELNQDFDISPAIRQGGHCLKGLLDIMKSESAGKKTIQALNDKLILSGILENLDIPHMPTLLNASGHVSRDEVGDFLDKAFNQHQETEVVIKPTHLSNGIGVISVPKPTPLQWEPTISHLTDHMNNFMRQRPAAQESLALKSVKPGYIAQPRYQSSVKFRNPLECRVICLWGKARMGIWWWGRSGDQGEQNSHRNTWIVRRPVKPDELSDDDCWEVIHEHRTGSNMGFDVALEVLERDMPTMAATTEALASAMGAPFLRVDFFVGSPKWGVRLNEVAYGCGCEYRNRTPSGLMIDDAQAMATILQDGYAQRPQLRQPDFFLSQVGAHGPSYEEMIVSPLFNARSFYRRRLADLFSVTGSGEEDDAHDEQVVPEDLCLTTRSVPVPRAEPRRSHSPPLPLPLAARRSHSPLRRAVGPQLQHMPAFSHSPPYPQRLQSSPFNFDLRAAGAVKIAVI